MGYIIIGLILFLLLVVFIIDLSKEYKTKHVEDIYYNKIENKFQNEFSEEFNTEDIENLLKEETVKTNNFGIGVDPILSKIKQDRIDDIEEISKNDRNKNED